MMRKILSIGCILSLIPVTVSAASSKSRTDSASKKTKPLVSLLEATQPCKVVQPEILSNRSQGNLNLLFENMACSGIGEFLNSDALDLNYCLAVDKCVDFQDDKMTITNDDKDFLEGEAVDFLVRETTQIEMDKYTNSETFQDMLSFIKKMPEKYQKQIVKCELSKELKDNSCNERTTDALIAQHYIRTSLDKKIQSNASAALKTETDVEKMPVKMARSSRRMANVADLAQDAKSYQELKTQSFSDVYESLITKEKERADSAHYNSTDFDPENDSVVNHVVESVLKIEANVQKLTAGMLKEIVRESLARVSKNGNDYIFNYSNRLTTAVIDKALDEINFNPKDFIVHPETGRSALAEKINQIRVRLANSHMAEDCQKTNTSIAQVCSNISKTFQSGGAVNVLYAYRVDPFKKMIEYYEKSDVPNKDKKIARLEEMRTAKGDIFKRFLSFSLQDSTCHEKYSSEIASANTKKRSQNRSQARSEKITELEKAAESSRAHTIAILSDTAKRSDNFQKEIKALGVKFNNDASKNDIIAIDHPIQASKAQSSDVSVRSNSFVDTQKAVFPDQNTNQFNKNIKPFEPSISENMNNFNVIDDKKDKNSYDYEQKLRSKFSELESKEKAISKKVSQVSSDAAATDKDESSDELLDLRRQIEELKKSQSKTVGDQKIVAAKQAENIEEVKTPTKNSSLFGSKSVSNDNSSDRSDSSAGTAPIAASNINTSNFDTQGDDRAATRGPASVNYSGASATSAKGASEKATSGIVLSKSGEVMQDTASILDNPKENEIANLIEVTNGQPFLIRENGVLMKVTVALDTNGKPQIEKGKIRFKKVPLSKAQQETIIKEANLNKSMKELDRDPTRLFNLKSLLKEAVKRE